MFRLTHCVLVLFVDVSLGVTGGEEEDVVAFLGGDSAREDKGMCLCIGGDDALPFGAFFQVDSMGLLSVMVLCLREGGKPYRPSTIQRNTHQ